MNDTGRKNVVIICGSDSDLPQIQAVCESANWKMKITIHIISCHRNPQQLRDFVFNRLQDDDVVICAGSKALALPGVVDAWAHYLNRNVLVAGVALGEPGSAALFAAQLSITEIPSQPVIFDEAAGEAYTGATGLRRLLNRIENGDLPPVKPRKEKPARTDVWHN